MQERLTHEKLLKYAHPQDGQTVFRPQQRACAELLEARELIESLCRDVCGSHAPDGEINSVGLSHTADAMRYLASIGRLEIKSDDGVRVVGRLKP